MSELPSSIEAYLQEAGFSGTEIIVLKKLLEEDALTLRELAAKTGKSTGVLDLAVKKLLKKNILTRESINDTPKYGLRSLNSVLAWMEEDMKLKQEMMQRRHQNFETFVRSLVVGKKRPEMEFFEGIEGIKKAYEQLLLKGNDIIQYGPTLYLAEEDPLRDFRVQYFKQRRSRGIFSRIITHDTVLGRRFQSRDIFEYRKTILVDAHHYPFLFERIVIGDTIACFQLQDERACFIKYPELAQHERIFFEKIWNHHIESHTAEKEDVEQAIHADQKVIVPLKTKTFSQLRAFFLSRTSMVAFALCALLAGGFTYGLYKQNAILTLKRIQDRAQSIAATGALQFEENDIRSIRSAEDEQQPSYAKTVYLLNQIRNQNQGVKHVYIVRYAQNTGWQFVADADAPAHADSAWRESGHQSYPGASYDVGEYATRAHEALRTPIAFDPVTNDWGTVVSGWAPIPTAGGEPVAILGVDMEAGAAAMPQHNAVIPVAIFAALFLLFALFRLAAFNRSLLHELIEICRAKRVMVTLIAAGVVALLLSVALYIYDVRSNQQKAHERILAIATTGAVQFSPQDIEALRTLKDIETPAYQRVVRQLHDIRSANTDIKYAYILRPRKGTTTFEFIADADAYGRDIFKGYDINGDGIINESDEVGYPGLQYDVTYIEALREGRYFAPVINRDVVSDKWGDVYTAYAPITDEYGAMIGLLAIDMDAHDVRSPSMIIVAPIVVYIIGIFLYVLFATPQFYSSLLFQLINKMSSKKVMYTIIVALMIVYWITFGLYIYTVRLIKEESGKRLMSIAVTAAAQIEPQYLEHLRFARDMKRPEYQHVFQQLNAVRDRNPDITYIYILRSTHEKGIWEFVVDADSNYYIPFSGAVDYDGNTILDEADENVAPGVWYDYAWPNPVFAKYGVQQPTYEVADKDQWGATINATAPIVSAGEEKLILGIDMLVNKVFIKREIKFLSLLLFIEILLIASILFRVLTLNRIIPKVKIRLR